VQRRRVEKQIGAAHQRQQGASGQAEGMKQRQRVKKLVVGADVDHGTHLFNVGHDGAMRQRHALGFAL